MSTGYCLMLMLLISSSITPCHAFFPFIAHALGMWPLNWNTGTGTGTGTGSNTGSGVETTVSSTITTASAQVESRPAMTCGGVEYKSFTKLKQRMHTFEEEVLDDFSLSSEGAWFGEAGFKLLEFNPGMVHCGGRYPAWVQGIAHGDPEGYHQLTVCMETSSRECSKTWTIDAMSCEELTIYKLTKTPSDNTVYCVDYVDADNPPSTHFVDGCSVEIQTRETKYMGYTIFLCKFERLDKALYYQTYWFVNDKSVAVKEIAAWSENFIESSKLTEDDLKKAGFHKFGFDVRCSVRVRDNEGGFPGPSTLSERQFAGIKIENPNLSLKEDEIKQLSVISTVPFKCGTKFSNCDVKLEVRAPPTDDTTGCNPKPLVQTDCNVALKDANTLYHFKVKGETIMDNGDFYSLSKLNLTTISNEMPFFDEYTIGIATVEVWKKGNESVADGRMCYAVCDPHMKTFDGRYYEHHDPGHHVLYKNEEYNIEVHMSTVPCWYIRVPPTCPCAIAVRSGRTVFRFDRCGGAGVPWEIGFATCGGHPEEMSVHGKDSQYQVYLPTGTTIRVDLTYLHLNVYIYPSESDVHRTTGLCGTLNGNSCDDLKLKNGGYASYGSTCPHSRSHKDFLDSWRLEKHTSLFDDDVVKDLERFTVSASYCTCERKPDSSSTGAHNQVLCPATTAKQCIYPSNTRRVNSKNSCAIRRRRQRRSGDVGPNLESRRRRSTNGWTEESARAYCEELFNKSASVNLCRNIDEESVEQSTRDCIQDIQFMGDTTFSDMAVATATEQCGRKLMMNATAAAKEAATTNETTASQWEQFQKVFCVNECSHRGTCVEGICQCEAGYGAPDCSVDITKPPKTFGLKEDGVCDVTSRTCNVSHMLTEHIVENGISNCRTVFFEIDYNNRVTYGEALPQTLEVESIAEGVCTLPAPPLVISASNTVARGYLVSVSNDGKAYSDASAVVIFNSSCQQCEVANNVVTCRFLVNEVVDPFS